MNASKESRGDLYAVRADTWECGNATIEQALETLAMHPFDKAVIERQRESRDVQSEAPLPPGLPHGVPAD